MSTDLVHADPRDVRRLATALQRFEQRITQISSETYREVGRANWHDRQKDQFEARFKDFHKKTNTFVGNEVSAMVKSLNSLAVALEQAQSQRF